MPEDGRFCAGWLPFPGTRERWVWALISQASHRAVAEVEDFRTGRQLLECGLDSDLDDAIVLDQQACAIDGRRAGSVDQGFAFNQLEQLRLVLD